MVHHDASRDLDGTFLAQGVAARRLEEEEGFSRGRIVQFLDVRRIVAANRDNLVLSHAGQFATLGRRRATQRAIRARTFLPRVTNCEAIDIVRGQSRRAT